ncbi:MAG TPA: M56 family metallopeptidase, partial [Planctomycetaceae bacterium]|nr:M56 family metallopeptidase [Planctomycetaceae bacterium]
MDGTSAATADRNLRARMLPLIPYVVAVWLCGVAVLSLRLLACWCCVERLRRRGVAEVSSEWADIFRRVCERMRVRGPVRLLQSTLVHVPAAFGWLRPVILLPASGLTGLSPRELEALLAHELAHIRRYDYVANLLQSVVETVLFYHPAVWWLSRRVRIERENCCDDAALMVCGNRKDYARALMRVAELHPTGMSLASAATGGELTHRIRRVLGLRPVRTSGGPSWLCGLVLLMLACGVTAALALPPDTDGPGAETARSNVESSGAESRAIGEEDVRREIPIDGVRGASAPGGPADDARGPDPRVTRLISPDGRRIAYGQFTVGPGGETSSRVIVANADLSERRAIDFELETSHEVLWYGNDLLAVSSSHDAKQYTLISAADGARRGTLGLPDGCDVLYKRFSPDGQRVAYVGRFDRDRDKEDVLHGMFIVDLKKGVVEQILSEAVKTVPAWSPDSTRLAIGAAGGYTKEYPLAIVRSAGEAARPRAEKRPSSSVPGAVSFWEVVTDAGDVTKLDVKGVGADWSPDGGFLAFTTAIVAGGSWHAGIPADGRIGVWDLEREQLTLVSQPAWNERDERSRWEYAGSQRPVWSPDSRWIAYRHVHIVRGGGTDTREESMWIVARDGSGRRKVLDHTADVAWTRDGRALIWVHEGRSGRIELDNLPELGDTPARPIGPFSVRGRVTDDDGKPLAGVEIRVARGWGSLRTTMPVLTDGEGRYEIHFGPGMLFLDDPVNLQSALVSARKPGYYEKTLGEHGRLGMAYQ